MSEMQIKIKKNYIIIGIVLIIVIVLASVYALYYKPKPSYDQSLLAYKKGVYNSILCQYSCPLIVQQFNKTTQSLPDRACVQQCTNTLKALNISGTQFSDDALLTDNLFADLDTEIRTCQSTSTEVVENITILNSSAFFECAKPAIAGLKEKYTYLE